MPLIYTKPLKEKKKKKCVHVGSKNLSQNELGCLYCVFLIVSCTRIDSLVQVESWSWFELKLEENVGVPPLLDSRSLKKILVSIPDIVDFFSLKILVLHSLPQGECNYPSWKENRVQRVKL